MTDTIRTPAALIALLADGAAAHSTNRQLLRDWLVSIPSMLGVVSVAEPRFAGGAKGDDSTDDYAAFAAAHDALPTTGGTIIIPPTPTNIYRLSQTWNITKPCHIIGTLPSSNVSTVNTGTILSFAPDKDGVVFNGDITLGDGVVASRGYAANYAIMEGLGIISRGGTTGLLNGGTGVLVDGIKLRCPGVTIRNCWAYFFHRNNLRNGGTAGSGGATEANANINRVLYCQFQGAGGDNVYCYGNDANVCHFTGISSVQAGGWNYNDDSAFGNLYSACHSASGVSGSYRCSGASAHHVYLMCYTELSGEPKAQINGVAQVFGGILGTESGIDPTSTGFAMAFGTSRRAQLQSQNVKGAVSVASGLCLNDTTQTVFTFGSSDESVNLNSNKLVYDNVNQWWSLINSASTTRRYIRFPSSALTLRMAAPLFEQGLYLGGFTNALQHMTTGSAAPTTGTWVKGDRVFNNYTVKGTGTGIEYWLCTLAGTPGTWVANRAFGTFTCAANTLTTIVDTAVTSTSRIIITPTNAAAGTLQAGTNALYVSAKTGATSFAVTTAAGGAAAGTETFDYVIHN